MKAKQIAGLCLALGLVLPGIVMVGSGCAGDRYSRSTGPYIDDATLEMRVFGALRDATDYKLGSVEVKTYRGVVQLSGFVNTPEQKRMAGKIAGRVEGVREVENKVTIKPDGGQNP